MTAPGGQFDLHRQAERQAIYAYGGAAVAAPVPQHGQEEIRRAVEYSGIICKIRRGGDKTQRLHQCDLIQIPHLRLQHSQQIQRG